MQVEVVYALPASQDIARLDLPAGASAADALAASGLLARHGLEDGKVELGIGGRLVAPASPLRDGDRVEILRPLAQDPREARRRRARRR